MSHDAYIPDYGDDRELQLNHEEFEYWLHNQKEQQEYKQYLDAVTNDFYGSSVTLMTEFN